MEKLSDSKWGNNFASLHVAEDSVRLKAQECIHQIHHKDAARGVCVVKMMFEGFNILI